MSKAQQKTLGGRRRAIGAVAVGGASANHFLGPY